MQYSIIIPAYNVERYVVQCLDSVFGQDYLKDDYEVIIVNDCSTDSTLDVIKQYKEQLSNLHPNANLILLNNETNIRQGGARNRGLKVATGKYVMFVDADDCWLANNVLSVYGEYMSKYDVDFIDVRECKEIKHDYHADTLQTFQYKYYTPISSTDRILVSDNLCSVWSSCYKRSYLCDKSLWFAENVCFEDTDWRIRCVSQTERIGLIDLNYYGYRCNPLATTKVYNKKLLYDNFLALDRLYDWVNGVNLKKENSEIILYRIKQNIIDNIKYGRCFKLRDCCDVFCSINKMSIKDIRFEGYNERLLFCIMKNVPIVIMLPLRIKYIIGQKVIELFKQ